MDRQTDGQTDGVWRDWIEGWGVSWFDRKSTLLGCFVVVIEQQSGVDLHAVMGEMYG